MPAIRPQDVLVHVGAANLLRYGTLHRRTWPGAAGFTHTRASTGWARSRSGLLVPHAVDVPRVEWVVDPATGQLEPTLLLEQAHMNELLDSSNFAASGTAWAGAGEFTIETAASIIEGETAYRHTNLGTSSNEERHQNIGNLTGADETLYAIVEQVDAAEFALGFRDETTLTWVFRVDFTWADATIATVNGSGTVRTTKLADSGPNGGTVYLIAITAAGTAGNTRGVYLYPSGRTQNTDAGILHHGQHEEKPVHSSPIVTAASAGTRAADLFSLPWAHGLRTFSAYWRFIERGTVLLFQEGNRIGQWGDGNVGEGVPLLLVRESNGFYRVEAIDSAGASLGVQVTTAPTIDQRVELLAQFKVDLGANTLRIRLLQSLDGGAVEDTGFTGTIAADFAAALTTVYVNSADGAANVGVAAFGEFVVAREEHLPNAFRRYLATLPRAA